MSDIIYQLWFSTAAIPRGGGPDPIALRAYPPPCLASRRAFLLQAGDHGRDRGSPPPATPQSGRTLGVARQALKYHKFI